MRRSNWLILLALFCLLSQGWAAVFRPHYSLDAKLLGYTASIFKDGESVLMVINPNVNVGVKEIPVHIKVVAQHRLHISWKGNLPPGMILIAGNSKDISRPPPWLVSTTEAIVEFPDVDDSDRKEDTEDKKVVYVVLVLGQELVNSRQKKVALVDLQYLYGVKKIYLNCSLCSVAARLLATGHQATLVDFNIDDYGDAYVQKAFAESDVIGVSLLGAPYIPAAIEFAERVGRDFPGKTVAFGGQVVEHISRKGFATLFANSANVKQVIDDVDFAELVGEDVEAIPHPLDIPYRCVYEQMEPERLRRYMQHEMTLEVSVGCVFNCKFCAARKGQRERMKELSAFEADIQYLAEQARAFGIETLQFYASSLDFFQSPRSIGRMLAVLARVQEDVGVRIKVRCLTSMSTFLHGREVINSLIQSGGDKCFRGFSDFSDLLDRGGLYCIGFGVDGSDESVWRQQNKLHNKTHQIQRCIDLCGKMGIRTEILMVLGFPEDTGKILWKTFRNSARYALNKQVVLRPYLAKTFIPGNDGWTPEVEEIMIADPQGFYNIDYCAINSPLTDPNRFHRWMANFTYLSIIGLFYPFGKCDTSPLLPQGQGGLYGAIAKLVNRIMPSDR